jgi:hypothetical protein
MFNSEAVIIIKKKIIFRHKRKKKCVQCKNFSRFDYTH